MTALGYIQAFFEHVFWADERVLKHLLSDSDNERARQLFAHVLAAEQVWLTRIQGQDSSRLEIWPAWNLSDCAAYAQQNRVQYQKYIASLGVPELEREVAYSNSQGAEFHTPVWQILTHVALHGSYHRGQIAQAVRSGGGVPSKTDYIAFVREQR